MKTQKILTFAFAKLKASSPHLQAVILLILSSLLYGQNVRKTVQDNSSPRIEIDASESDVLDAVKAIADDQTVHGTFEYERDKTLHSAHLVESSDEFGPPEDGGTVFYKAAENVLDPRHFKGSNGEGALTVRYIVRPVAADSTTLQIDAIFVEKEHHWIHKSDGTVEAAEFAAVRQSIATARKARLLATANPAPAAKVDAPQDKPVASVSTLAPATSSNQQNAADLERQVTELRAQVEAHTKVSGVQILSAPFASAPELKTLPAKSTVVVLVITPKWYGIESAGGQKGWVRRDQLEPVR